MRKTTGYNSDGTASDYAETTANGPAPQPEGATTAPFVSVSAVQSSIPSFYTKGGWYGTVTTSVSGSPYVNTNVGLAGKRADDKFGIFSYDGNDLSQPELGDDLGGVGGGVFGPEHGLPNSQSYLLDAYQGSGNTESPGETYDLDGEYYDADNPSDRGTPFTTSTTITLSGEPLPKLDIEAGVDSYGNPDITWTTPTGISGESVYVYYVHNDANGNPTATCLNAGPAVDQWPGSPMSAGQCTLSLPAGKWQVFAVYDAGVQSMSADVFSAFSPYSDYAQVTGGGVPAAPAAAAATWYNNSGGKPQVVVHWQNTSNNEANFLIQRATVVDGVTSGFTTLATVGSDTTSYTDSSVPINDQGDANLVYQVIAANIAGQSTPSPSAAVNVQVTSVTNVKFVLTYRVPNHAPVNHFPNSKPQQVFPALKSVDGYSFWDEIEVFGTNLQNVQWQQTMATQTTVQDLNTGATKLYGKDRKSNTPNFPNTFLPDGANAGGQWVQQPFLPMRWVQGYHSNGDGTKTLTSSTASGNFGVATYDHHNKNFPNWVYNAPSPPVSYTYVAKHTGLFKFDFRFPDPVAGDAGHQETKEFDWGYIWTNGNYQVSAGGPPTLPTDVNDAASPATPAANPASMLTGTNIDLSGVRYVTDINHP